MEPKARRRKTLPASPLLLKSFWVERLHVDADQSWEPGGESSPLPINGRTEIVALEGGAGYIVRLNVSTKRVRSPLPYGFDVTVAGNFMFPASFPEKEKDRFIHLNGSAILYGIARGLIASASGIGPHGPATLPSVNFVDFFEGSGRRRAHNSAP